MAALPKLRREAPHIEANIHRTLNALRPKPKKGNLRLSSIGDCERNLWAGFHGIPEDSSPTDRTLVIFELGNAIEAHVVFMLKLVGYRIEDQQHEIVSREGKVTGHTDGSIKEKSKPKRLLEIKSAKASKFEEVIAVGYEVWNPKYADQVQAYMGFTGLPEAMVVVYCKDDSRIYTEKIAFDPKRFGELQEKIDRILNAESILPRPEEAKSQYCSFCKWCSRNDWCWGPLAEVSFDA